MPLKRHRNRKTFIIRTVPLIGLILILAFTPLWIKITPDNGLQKIQLAVISMFLDNDSEDNTIIVDNKMKQQYSSCLVQLEVLQQKFDKINQFNTVESFKMSDAIKVDIVAKSLNPLDRSIIVNAGSKLGVKSHMMVVFQDSLVGIVETTISDFSRVRLISDRRFVFPVKGLKSNSIGAIYGQGNELLKIESESEFVKDEIITTFIFDGYAIPDIPVAIVGEDTETSPIVDIKNIKSVDIIIIDHNSLIKKISTELDDQRVEDTKI
ncbi:MAG: hypothetical protein JJV96_01575 [Alphaproteobacteria bacterium]|nr:hypothetical protein [Alphaproteobacteria bacterium]